MRANSFFLCLPVLGARCLRAERQPQQALARALPGWHTVIQQLRPRGRESSSSLLTLSIRGPTRVTSFNLDYLLKTPSATQSRGGLGLLPTHLGGTIQTVLSSHLLVQFLSCIPSASSTFSGGFQIDLRIGCNNLHTQQQAYRH